MNRNILIVGANSTIGKHIFRQLSLNDRNKIFTLSRSEMPESANHFQVDLLEEHPVFPEIEDPINEIYYLPGSIRLKPFKSLKIENFKMDIEINVLGYIKVIKQYLNNLKAGKASALSFSSVATKVGLDYHSSISTAKGALNGLTLSLAAEFAGSIRFNSVSLSLSNTSMAEKLLNNEKKEAMAKSRNPLGMIGDPENIADFAISLNSAKSNWLTGQIISYDGGMGNIKTFH